MIFDASCDFVYYFPYQTITDIVNVGDYSLIIRVDFFLPAW